MPDKKEYVKLWISYKNYFEAYSAAEVGRLVLAMIEYRESGASPEFSGSERFIWPAIRRDIDESIKAQESAAEANRENGKKGGRPKKPNETEENQKNQNGFLESEKSHGQGQRTKDKDNGHNNNPLPPKGAFEEFAEGDAELLTALKAFEAMRKKIKKPMSENAKGRLVAKLKHMSSDRGTWIAMLHQSEDRCWSDVYELKTEQKPKKSPNNMVGVNFNPDLERIKKSNDHLDKLLRELEGDDYMEKIESRWGSGS